MTLNGRIRPLDIRHDLEGLGELLEIAFAGELEMVGLDLRNEIEGIKRMAPLLLFLARISDDFRHLLDGFVWEEGDRIVASVTVHRRGRDGTCWEIGTVATHPDYRRRGLARRLVTRAIDYVAALGGEICVLEVRSDNPPAYDLYRSLGFSQYDSISDLKLDGPLKVQAKPADGYQIRPLELAELPIVYDLALRETPAEVQSFVPVRESQYRVSHLRRLLTPLLERLQRRDNYRISAECNGKLVGYARLKAKRGSKSPHELLLTVDPSHHSPLGEPLLTAALEKLGEYSHQDTVVSVRTSYTDLLGIFERYGFREIMVGHKLGKKLTNQSRPC